MVPVGGSRARAVENRAAVLFNDAACDPESKAGADRVLGRDEGREEALANRRLHAGAAVRDEARDAGLAVDDATAGAEGELGVLGGVDGVDEEIGEDLADLTLKAIDAQAWLDVRAAGEALELKLAGEEIDDAVQHGAEVDLAGAGGVAVEAEGLLGDLRDAREFVVGGLEHALDGGGHGGVCLAEIDEVGDRLERVVDLVRDGGGEAAGGGELFRLAEGCLLRLAIGDVLHGADHADELLALH